MPGMPTPHGIEVAVLALLLAACGNSVAPVSADSSAASVSSRTPTAELEAASEATASSRQPPTPTFDDLDPSTIEIRLSRTRCLGWCPDYSIVLHGDGRVSYTGRSFVLEVGDREGTASRDSIRALVALFQLESFFELDMHCSEMVTDVPDTTIRFTLGARSREVTNRWSGDDSDPSPEEKAHIPVHQSLDALADAIDHAVNIEQWIGTESQRENSFRNSRDGRLPSATPKSEYGIRSTSVADLPPPQGDDQIAASKLLEEARRLAAAGPASEHDALEAFGNAEDEAAKGLDRSMSTGDETASAFFETLYKRILVESDTFVSRMFIPNLVESTPSVDLLAPDQEVHWQKNEFQESRLESGILRLVGPAIGASENGLVLFPDSGALRDFQLEMEFALKGKIDVLFRIGRRVDNTVERWTLSTQGPEPLIEGRTYTLQASMIGSHLSGRLVPDDVKLPSTDSSWFMSRKGAIGIQLHEAAELKITRFRLRRLRDG
jgi:hypothetical protein